MLTERFFLLISSFCLGTSTGVMNTISLLWLQEDVGTMAELERICDKKVDMLQLTSGF